MTPPTQCSVNQAAELLGVSPNTVQSWLARGDLLSLYRDDVDGLRKRLDADWDNEGRRIV